MRRRSSMLPGLVLFGAMLLGGCGRMIGIPSSMIGQTLTEEQKFTLKKPDGGVLSLAQLLSQKKLVLLNFWATWCTYCVEEMPDLVKLQNEHAPEGFTVLAVNAGESAAQASAFAKKMGLNFPVVLDEDMSVAQRYGLVGIPTSFLISSDGKVIGQYSGFTPKLVSDAEKNL